MTAPRPPRPGGGGEKSLVGVYPNELRSRRLIFSPSYLGEKNLLQILYDNDAGMHFFLPWQEG